MIKLKTAVPLDIPQMLNGKHAMWTYYRNPAHEHNHTDITFNGALQTVSFPLCYLVVKALDRRLHLRCPIAASERDKVLDSTEKRKAGKKSADEN